MFLVRQTRGSIAIPMLGLLAGGMLGAQAPLPQPKPIVVPPMPQPGQMNSRPKPSAPDPELARTDNTGSKPDAVKPAGPVAPRGAKGADYGSTPAPWPAGGSDPAHFPAGIPRVDGAWQEAYSFGPLTASAWFHCGSPPSRVARNYEAFLAREQWQLVPIPGPPLEEERIVIARKGDWSLRVDAVPHPSGGTEVFVAASLKPLAPPPGARKGRP